MLAGDQVLRPTLPEGKLRVWVSSIVGLEAGSTSKLTQRAGLTAVPGVDAQLRALVSYFLRRLWSRSLDGEGVQDGICGGARRSREEGPT